MGMPRLGTASLIHPRKAIDRMIAGGELSALPVAEPILEIDHLGIEVRE